MERGLKEGIYMLVLAVSTSIAPSIAGHKYQLPPGNYLYIGSACGPGGLRARLRRHLCGDRRRAHWHIDRIIEAGAEPVVALAISSAGLCRPRAEPYLALCAAASRALEPFGRRIGGSDDELAPTHLFRVGDGENTLAVAERLAAAMPGLWRSVTAQELCRRL